MDKKIIAILRKLFCLTGPMLCFLYLLCAEMPDEIPHSVCQRIESRIEMLNGEYITIFLHCARMICYFLSSVQMKISNPIYFYDTYSAGTVIRIICA